MLGFTLDGKHSSELGLVLTARTDRPMLPRSRDTTVTLPGRHGELHRRTLMQARQFTLELEWATAGNRAVTAQRLRDLSNLLLDKYGEPRDVELEFDDDPGKKYSVQYSGRIRLDRMAMGASLRLQLVAFNPWAYSDEKVASMDVEEEGSMEVETLGTVVTPTVIRIVNIGSKSITGIKIRRQSEVE